MPAIEDNPRWEKFAQLVASGKSHVQAYKGAGFEGNDNTAKTQGCKVSKYPEVTARIRELQDRNAHRLDVTVDQLVRELDHFIRQSKKMKQPAAGVGAVIAKAKLLGLMNDKSDVVVSYRKPAREPIENRQMSIEEWTKKFAPKMLDEDAPR